MAVKWFVVTIILQCLVDGVEQTSWTVDRQLRVVRATHADKAFDKATRIGADAEHTYENEIGQHVRWVFVGVQDVEELLSRTIQDGTEITSEILHTADPTAYVATKAELVGRKN